MADAGFGAIAAVLLASAFFVVWSRDLVRAVFWLSLLLISTAVLYAMLGASFLAGVQVLTYVGGVVTLMVFGVMVTRRVSEARVEIERGDSVRGLLVAGGLFSLMAIAILESRLPSHEVPMATMAELAAALVGPHVLAFETVSLLLLGAIIGAVVIARKHDPVAVGAQAAEPAGQILPLPANPRDAETAAQAPRISGGSP